ncbi:MAG: acetolactate synthase small subunit, partial [Bacillota bacterium]
VVGIFRAKIVDVAEKSIIVEVTGDEGKIDAFVQLARPYGIIEIVRTGKVSMVRGSK